MPHGRPWAGAFNVVMATSIVSIAAQRFGLDAISIVLLCIAGVAFVPLAALDARHVLHPRHAMRSLERAKLPWVGFPTLGFVADTTVLGARILLLGGGVARVIAAVLFAMGALVWVPVLALSLPRLIAALVGVGDGRDETLVYARAEWLLGMVSAEGLAVVAGGLAAGNSSVLHYVAVVLWIFGGLLYLATMGLLAQHFGRYSLKPHQVTPDLWIVMGAPAIVALAGATAFHGSVGSPAGALVIVSWLVASALMPLIIAGELWRATRLGPPRFAPERWTMVFPLGMYSVAGMVAGQRFHIAWIAHVGHWFFPVALAAWVLVAVGELRFAFRGRAAVASSRT